MNMLLLSGRHSPVDFCCDVCRRRSVVGRGARFVVPYDQHGINLADQTVDVCLECLTTALAIANRPRPAKPKPRAAP